MIAPPSVLKWCTPRVHKQLICVCLFLSLVTTIANMARFSVTEPELTLFAKHKDKKGGNFQIIKSMVQDMLKNSYVMQDQIVSITRNMSIKIHVFIFYKYAIVTKLI